MAVHEDLRLTEAQLAELQRKLAARMPAKRVSRMGALYTQSSATSFARMPYPDVLRVAASVNNVALGVFIGIVYESWRQKSRTIELPTAVFESAGINRHARGRALNRLVEAGIIEVDQPKGRHPQVRVLWLPSLVGS